MLIKVKRRFSENGGRRGTVRPMGANRPCDGPARDQEAFQVLSLLRNLYCAVSFCETAQKQ